MGKRKSPRLNIDEKIDMSLDTPVFESKNRQYSKITHNGKVTYISFNKDKTQVKTMSAKQFRNLKKIIPIKESYNKLQDAFNRTNQDTTQRLKSGEYIYKKYKDDKGKTRYLKLNEETQKIEKTYSFKQAINIFRKIKKERDIKIISQMKGISYKDAKQEWNSKQEYLKENQIKNIMEQKKVSRDEANKERIKLVRGGRMDILLGRYTTFNPDSAYQTIN